MIFHLNCPSRVRIVASSIALIYLIIGTMLTPTALASNHLEITDDYLKGLSEEISKPEYVTKAKAELRETEKLEQSQSQPNPKVKRALGDQITFESLLQTEYPASYQIYSELSIKSRLVVFKNFRSSKRLSAAKRMIIDMYLDL